MKSVNMEEIIRHIPYFSSLEIVSGIKKMNKPKIFSIAN